MSNIKYRKDIDGLRALAVLSVILFHLDISWVKSGFLGVDIFFVISGYLITSIIVRDLNNKTFSLKSFYLRRMRRILPALIFVLVVTTFFAWLVLLPQDLKNYSKSLVSALGSFSNLYFFKSLNFGYFSTDATVIPLLHTWSLGVEEQFYLLWPLFLAIIFSLTIKIRIFRLPHFLKEWNPSISILWKEKVVLMLQKPGFNISKLSICLLLTILLTVTSLLLFKFLATLEITTYFTQQQFYYFPLTRAFELLFGCILAIHLYGCKPISNKLILNMLSILAFIFMLYPILLKDVTYPSNWMIVACLGAVMYIYSGSDLNYVPVLNKIFSSKIFVAIGLISYSLYLWHWPIIAYLNYLSIDKTVFVDVIVFILSILLATISYFFIEKPFRYRFKFSFIKTIMILWVLPFALSVSFALCSKYINSFGYNKPYGGYIVTGNASSSSLTYEYPGYKKRLGELYELKSIWSGNDYRTPIELKNLIKDRYDVVVFGDSHAQAAISMINVWTKQEHLKTLLAGGTQGLIFHMIKDNQIKDSVKAIIEKAQPKIFIISGWWNSYTENTNNLNNNDMLQSIDNILQILETDNIQPIILLDWPSLKGMKPTCGMMKINSLLNKVGCTRTLKSIIKSQSIELEYINRMQQKYPNLIIIDPKKIICHDGNCSNTINNTIIYQNSIDMPNGLNNAHLNEHGSALIGELYQKKYGNPLK
ncbi:acyltransferase family protein [Francisella philomiragia]|uniref:acyltransferase family protein n=1 Tax=Francisella philomiragia TaxID=28110 RepID=UPI003518CE17